MLEEIGRSIIATGPLAALLFLIWYLERQERIKKDQQKDQLTERFYDLAKHNVEAMEGLRKLFDSAQR